MAYEDRFIQIPDVWCCTNAYANSDSNTNSDTYANSKSDSNSNTDSATTKCSDESEWKCGISRSDQSDLDGQFE